MSASLEYLETQVLTASPHRLHLMVIDGTIRFARQGAAAMQERRWDDMDACFNRARDCLTELIGGLNSSADARLAEQIKSLFAFAYRNLVLGELARDSQQIEDAIRILNLHRETWVELGVKLASGTAAPVPPNVAPAPHLSMSRSWVT